MQADEVVELVTSVGGGGEPEPAAGGDLGDGGREGRGGDVVALVDDDQAVAGGEVRDVLCAGEGLQGGDIDDPGGLAASAAPLAGVDPKEFPGADAPLVRQGLRSTRTRVETAWVAISASDGLAGAGRGDQHAEVVPR